ncbi:MAG: hypothetical protein J6R42_03675, partial [Clostridia bacterium]|nr:hypothetical protein [Clostridia bacterium]
MQKPSFQNPPSLYRPHSFWSLNERLNPQTLCEQIDDMHSAGWGGFYFHSRGGLITPYMGEEWMACFDAAMKHAKALGMKAWLYDEDTWPSGTASCTIPKLDPAFRETHIFYAYDKIPHQKEDVLASYVYRAKCEPTGNHRMYGLEEHLPPVDLVPITPDEAENCPEGYRNVYIYIWRAPASNSRFGGCSYTDLMNPDATRAFIRSTHEKYAALFGEEFGGVIPGIFTDDITIQWDLYGAKRNAMPWTGKLPEAFLALNGYDILEHLPDLFFDTPEASATRMDYIRVINRLFAENFVGVIAQWCDEHNLALTGHLMGNEGGYSDVMYQYYLMQIPATDHLGKNIRNFRRPRRALSVADQFDKPYTICETSAGGGHDMTMEEQKRLTDFLLVAGARVMVPHVTQYSMRGSRKYDHPPAFSARDPYWSEMHWLADYQGRLAYALSQGKMDAHVLLLDNIESKHISCAPAGRSRQYDALNNALDQVERELLSAHCEFAYGSEELLSRFGRVENGELCLGSGRYSAVIIPPALTLRSSTLSLLKELKAQGGEVVAMLRAPALCDGRKNNPYLPFLATVSLLHYHQIKDFAAPYAL